MSETATPALAYATKDTALPRGRRVHVWALPLLWLPGGIGSCYYYGDEYSAFGGAHLPVVLILDRFSNLFRTIHVGMIVTVVIGAILLALVGVALDTLRTSRWTWLGMIVVAGIATWVGVANITPKWWARGEASVVFWTMFFLSWCWGVYALAAAAIVFTPLVRLLRRR